MTHQLAVFGNPIAHSLSPQIHQQFAESAGIDIRYEKVLVPLGEFQNYAKRFFSDGGVGLNITVPFKQDAFAFAEEHSLAAITAGAVNTLTLSRQGELLGDNTDGTGLINDLQKNLGWQINDKRILVLGAGGAVQGVLRDLLDANPESITLANRTHEKAVALQNRFGNQKLISSPLDELSDSFDLIISGSSAGLNSEDQPFDLSASLLTPDTCCYDMIYGKKTPFLTWARSRSNAADGLGMLVEQAARSFELWFGVKVDTKPVLKQLRSL